MINVLCIEPNKVLAKTYIQALEHVGYSVMVATNAEDAIVLADEQRPDIVILELQLPGHGGVEFLHEFRSYEDWQDVPVIVNTQITPVAIDKARDALQRDLGVKGFLYKPRTSLQKLISAVNEQAHSL
jgi:CheY-like chemotaxis protein